MIEAEFNERTAFLMNHPIAAIRLAHGPSVVCELFPEEAPNTVRSFLYLARLGCFDRHAMERLALDFVADMSYTAFGRPEAKYLIPYETQSAGFPNHLKADVGTIVMGGYENGIAGGEFFFPLKSNPKLTWTRLSASPPRRSPSSSTGWRWRPSAWSTRRRSGWRARRCR